MEKIKFSYHSDGYTGSTCDKAPMSVEMVMEDYSMLDDVLENFTSFIKSAGFLVNSNESLQFVDDGNETVDTIMNEAEDATKRHILKALSLCISMEEVRDVMAHIEDSLPQEKGMQY